MRILSTLSEPAHQRTQDRDDLRLMDLPCPTPPFGKTEQARNTRQKGIPAFTDAAAFPHRRAAAKGPGRLPAGQGTTTDPVERSDVPPGTKPVILSTPTSSSARQNV